MTTKTVKEIEDQIRALLCEGELLADKTGEIFNLHAADRFQRYIPASSPEYEEYDWTRDEYGIPEGQGFWYNSSMSC